MSNKDRRKQVLAKQARNRLDDTLQERVEVKDVLGLDPGTGTCLTAISKNGEAEVLKGPEGMLMKSAVYRDLQNRQVLVGEQAFRSSIKDPANLFANFKPMMELNASKSLSSDGMFTVIDAMAALMHQQLQLAKKLVPRLACYPQLGGNQYKASNLRIAIAVPAGWGLNVTDSMLTALVKAGVPEDLLDTVVFIKEPHAAAAAALGGLCGLRNGDRVAVLDFGAGTSDNILLQLRDGLLDTICPPSGITDLGGSNHTAAVASIIAQQIRITFKAERNRGDGFRLNRASISEKERLDQYKIWLEAENVKQQLMTADKVVGYVETRKGLREYTITLEEVMEAWKPLFEEIEASIVRLEKDSEIPFKDIPFVVLAGGASLTPGMLELVARATHRNVEDVAMTDHPQHDIVIGTCILSQKLGDVATATNNGYGMRYRHRDTGELVYEQFIPKGTVSPVGGIDVERLSTVVRSTGGIQTVRLEPFITKPGIDANVEGALLKDTETIPLKPVEADFELPSGEHRTAVRMIHTVGGRSICVLSFPEVNGSESVAVSLHVDDAANVQEKAPRSVIICFDSSSSMKGEPIEKARSATLNFCKDMVGDGAEIAIVAFGGKAEMICPFTADPKELQRHINEIDAGGGTPMAEALRIASTMAQDVANAACMVFSDGHATDEGVDEAAETLKQAAELFTIAVGEHADHATLHRIASSDDNFMPVERAADLPRVFDKVRSLLYTGDTSQTPDASEFAPESFEGDVSDHNTVDGVSNDDDDDDDENAGDWEEVA